MVQRFHLRSVRHRLVVVACISMGMVAPAAAESDALAEDLLDLSLNDLLNVQVTGAAVRDLGLQLPAQTGNPFRWPMQQIAASVESIDHDTMQARGLNNVIEAAENLVGVLSGDSPAEPHSFSMRGFSRDSINVLHDGISVGIATLNTRPQGTYNLDRLEIVKGAATLQHGQGAAGGSINLISRKPLFGSGTVAEAIVEYGSFNSSMLGLGLSASTSDRSAYRLDVSRTASAGYVEDADSESINLTGSMHWRPGADTTLKLSINLLDDELPAYWGTPLVPRSVARDPLSGVVRSGDGRVVDAATRRNNYNVDDHAIRSQSLLTRFDIERDGAGGTRWEAAVYGYTADRDWRNAETYRFNPSTGRVDRDRLLVDHRRDLHGLRAGVVENHVLGGRDNRWSVHLEYSDNDFRRQVGFDADNPEPFVDSVDLFNPDAGVFGDVDVRSDRLRATVAALVLEDAWQFDPHWRLDLAFRHEWLSIDRERLNFAGQPIGRSVIDRQFRETAYRVGLHHQWNEALSVYGHVSRQHDPVESDLTEVFVAANFEPSDLRQVEVGMKALLDDAGTEFTAAVFQAEKRQRIQLADLSFRTNEQGSQGLEIAIRSNLTEDVRLGGSLAYTDTTLDRYYDAVYERVVDGARPINVPEWMGSVWFSVNRVGGLPIEVGGGVHHVTDRFGDSANTTILEAYTLTSAFVAYAKDRLRIALTVRNAMDEDYAPWSDATYPDQILLGAPRSYELSFQAKF